MVFHCSSGNPRDDCVYRTRRGDRPAAVELAGAGFVRMAGDLFLAGGWIAGPVPDSLRGLWFPRWPAFQNATENVRAMGTDDARRAGEVPAELSRPLRALRAAGTQTH